MHTILKIYAFDQSYIFMPIFISFFNTLWLENVSIYLFKLTIHSIIDCQFWLRLCLTIAIVLHWKASCIKILCISFLSPLLFIFIMSRYTIQILCKMHSKILLIVDFESRLCMMTPISLYLKESSAKKRTIIHILYLFSPFFIVFFLISWDYYNFMWIFL